MWKEEGKVKYESDNFRNPISKEEIERIRHRIRIGEVIPVEVNKIDWSTEFMVFRKV